MTRWFADEARDLPWRRRRSGYTALIAETMLQQTQVSRVVDRFESFLDRFPSLPALAAADEQEVLALWQGLGYYRRAQHLLAAAQRLVEQGIEDVPGDPDQLRRLPGVGRYTAGAIASIVFDRPEPVVDGNVLRVLARWDALDAPATAKSTIDWAWARAQTLVEQAPRPSQFNEAIMELGALICTPKSPRCSSCPVASQCRAFEQGRQSEIPAPRPRARQRRVHHHAVVMRRAGTVLLEQRGSRGLWSSMWQTPTVEAEQPLPEQTVVTALAGRGLRVSSITERGSFPYQTTHRRITFHVFAASTRVRRGRWQPIDALDGIPLSNAHRRVLEAALEKNP